MNTEDDNSRQGNMNSSTQKELVVELNSETLKTIQSLQVDLQSFKDDNMNERKEQKTINEALLRNMMGGSLGQPTHSTNTSKIFFILNGPATQRKKEKKNTPLNLQKDIITFFLVIIPFLLAERNRGMMTTSKDISEK